MKHSLPYRLHDPENPEAPEYLNGGSGQQIQARKIGTQVIETGREFCYTLLTDSGQRRRL